MSIHGEEDCYELNEDLLQLKYTRANIIIDLGWYPAHNCVREVPLTKQEFVEILDRLRKATELVDKVEELFRGSRENLECDFCNGAGLQISHEGIVVKLLEKLMRDSFGNISEKTIRFSNQNSQKTIEKARMTIKTE